MVKKPSIKSQIVSKLEKVLDPELNISIIDLGLIYKVTFPKKDKVKITMTLTAMGCPLFPVIERDALNRIQELGFEEKNIIIDLTFDPPWSMDKMTEKGKAILGI